MLKEVCKCLDEIGIQYRYITASEIAFPRTLKNGDVIHLHFIQNDELEILVDTQKKLPTIYDQGITGTQVISVYSALNEFNKSTKYLKAYMLEDMQGRLVMTYDVLDTLFDTSVLSSNGLRILIGFIENVINEDMLKFQALINRYVFGD